MTWTLSLEIYIFSITHFVFVLSHRQRRLVPILLIVLYEAFTLPLEVNVYECFIVRASTGVSPGECPVV